MKKTMIAFAVILSSVTASAASSDCAALFGKYILNFQGTLVDIEIQSAGPDSVSILRGGVPDVKIVDGKLHTDGLVSYTATCSQTEGLTIVLDDVLMITTKFQATNTGVRFTSSVGDAELVYELTPVK